MCQWWQGIAAFVLRRREADQAGEHAPERHRVPVADSFAQCLDIYCAVFDHLLGFFYPQPLHECDRCHAHRTVKAASKTAQRKTCHLGVVAAGVGDTVRTELFGREWPFQQERVIRNRTVEEWDNRAVEAMATPVGEPVGTTVMGGTTVPVPSFSAALPTPDTKGDFEQFNLTAGESCGNIDEIHPAGEIVRRMSAEALDVLNTARFSAGNSRESVEVAAARGAAAGV